MTQRVLFITGAGSGMGQMTALQALDAGWKVAAVDLNAAGLEQLGENDNLLRIALDVTDHQAVAAAVEHCENTLGSITRVVHAAGIMPLGELTDQPQAMVMKIMTINYGGMVNVVDTAVKKMLQRGEGEFVSYASMAGHWPIMYMGAYNAAKHAVAAYTEVLYHETRNSGVRIVCVCPPIVATPLLKQAQDTVWPKLFDIFPALEPQVVVDAAEKALTRRRGLWVFPGPMTRLTWLLRRWCPSLLWQVVHWAEKK
ncbi:SDR family oxidoreductase [Pseudomaricurvus alcaniphilus]|uniref:SDR family NAD(P)-dependent oxidoreductase n=1 Tax=Pseudomaricurvus alcaniphilus TaxID=1166482 RepID=UPI001409A1D9|nr:SDR family oxidoreductase [Pseudomaricurvus alcaniphilus]NHN39016.1 SDR family oxidoreductase [Pseudomaricurvus alcaniphilus]